MKYVLFLCANLMLPGSGMCDVQVGQSYANTTKGKAACLATAEYGNRVINPDGDGHATFYCYRTGKKRSLQIADAKPKMVTTITVAKTEKPQKPTFASIGKKGSDTAIKVAEKRKKPVVAVQSKKIKWTAKVKREAPVKAWHPLMFLFGG